MPGQAIVSGSVYEDRDENLSQGTGEPGVSGLAVTLRTASDGALYSGTTTDAAGHYGFFGVAPGGYTVEIAVPPGATVLHPANPLPVTVISDTVHTITFALRTPADPNAHTHCDGYRRNSDLDINCNADRDAHCDTDADADGDERLPRLHRQLPLRQLLPSSFQR